MAHVVLLRGVNVGGHRVFRPAQLAARLKHLDVVNIGAAGTFVVRQAESPAQLLADVRRHLPFDAHVMICPGREIVRLLSRPVFEGYPPRSDLVRFVTVLARTPRSGPAVPLSLPDDGRWALRVLARHGRYVFGVYRREMKAIRYLGALDRMFGAPATTRNWNTITAIARTLGVEEPKGR